MSPRLALLCVGVVMAIALYVAGVPGNPPGFFVDESSIAYNAHTISQQGVDGHGERWPLYFRAFGEYKNPVFIYLLAALYSVFGPSQLVARLLSASELPKKERENMFAAYRDLKPEAVFGNSIYLYRVR